jgi:hypothetical protein
MQKLSITKQALLGNIPGIHFYFDKGFVFGVEKGGTQVLIRASESKFHTHECKGRIGHAGMILTKKQLFGI